MPVRMRVYGDMSHALDRELVAIRAAATHAVRKAALGVRKDIARDLRKVVKRSPNTISKAIRTRMYPDTGESLHPKGVTYSKAIYDRNGGFDLLALHDVSYVIVPNERKWLAIPTASAPMKRTGGRPRKASPKESGIKMVFIRQTHDRAFLLDPKTNKIMYILRRGVRRVKKIDILANHRKRGERIAQDFIQVLAEYGVSFRGK